MTEVAKNDKISLKYNYITDGGNIDSETFACTKGHTITLNKFLYDDTEYLKTQYAKAVSEGVFARYNKRYISALRQVCEKHAGEKSVSFVRHGSGHSNYVREKTYEDHQ